MVTCLPIDLPKSGLRRCDHRREHGAHLAVRSFADRRHLRELSSRRPQHVEPLGSTRRHRARRVLGCAICFTKRTRGSSGTGASTAIRTTTRRWARLAP